jgi:hypothetical protein
MQGQPGKFTRIQELMQSEIFPGVSGQLLVVLAAILAIFLAWGRIRRNKADK